jgi:hypothetical protein
MTLDEFIAMLNEKRAETGKDVAVRLLIRDGTMARQFECIDVRVADGYHDQLVLILGGEMAATSDWPMEAR